MSATGANTPANHFGGSFGPNEWLVQEMYERYQQDPQSVDKSWWDFFADFKGVPTSAGSSNGFAGANGQRGVPPIPKQTKLNQQKNLQAAQGTNEVINQVAAPVTQIEKVVPAVQVNPVIEQVNEVVQPAPVIKTPADPIKKATPTITAPASANVQPLRGVAARVVQSMEASLTVPTATSVRAIPAKLMIDNRTVINNHLKRGRGGKVSFTHLIGYAMIKAVRAMPEMNAFFTELDGKPAVGQPEHMNLVS